MTRLARFYPIVDSADWVRRLLPCGVRLIQLRLKHATPAAIRHEVRAALALCASRVQLVVNDHWEIALDEGANFIHLGQHDLDGADLKAIRAGNMRLGVSTHDHGELERALDVQADYIALGPIYPTASKIMPWMPQGLDRLREWKRRIGHRPLVAIGGITPERVADCFEAGADGIAAIGDVSRHPDPLARAGAWVAATSAPA